MALSGSVTTTSYSDRSVTLNWTATQNVSNNTSTISWNLVGSGSNDGYFVVVSEIRVTINDSVVYYRDSSNHTNCYYGTQLANGSTAIVHSEDGTKSFAIKVEAGIYQWAINCSKEKTFTLDAIARASTISAAGNVTLGNTCSVSWVPASASFRYKIKFSLGDWTHTTGYISPNRTTSYTYTGYTIPVSVSTQLPNSTTGTMTAYLYTYNGTTKIGSTSSKAFTVTVPTSVIPTLESLTVSLVNDNTVINGWGVAVSGYTKVNLSATAVGSQGSTISSFVISGGYSTTQNGSSLSYTGSVISSSGNKTFTVQAKDSRKRSSSALTSQSITFYAYAPPSVTSFSVSRSAQNSRKMIVTADWSFSSVNGNNNSIGTLYYKRSNASNWTTYGIVPKNTDVTLTPDFDESASYNFKIIVTDDLDNQSQEEAFVSTISVLMDFRAGGRGLGIGKIAESDNLEVALNSIFIGNVYIKVGNSNVLLKDYIKNTIDGLYD